MVLRCDDAWSIVGRRRRYWRLYRFVHCIDVDVGYIGGTEL